MTSLHGCRNWDTRSLKTNAGGTGFITYEECPLASAVLLIGRQKRYVCKRTVVTRCMLCFNCCFLSSFFASKGGSTAQAPERRNPILEGNWTKIKHPTTCLLRQVQYIVRAASQAGLVCCGRRRVHSSSCGRMGRSQSAAGVVGCVADENEPTGIESANAVAAFARQCTG